MSSSAKSIAPKGSKATQAKPKPASAAELEQLRDEAVLLRQACEERWHEIATLTRMIQSLETEKIENRSADDRDRRELQGEIAALRRMLEKAGGKPAGPSDNLRDLAVSEGEWEQMYRAVLNSTSWKLTRPVRALSNLARRLLRRG